MFKTELGALFNACWVISVCICFESGIFVGNDWDV